MLPADAASSEHLLLSYLDCHGIRSKSFAALGYVQLPVIRIFSKSFLVPAAVVAAGVNASLYDVPGGYRAVMFDRFSGVRAIVRDIVTIQSNVQLLYT